MDINHTHNGTAVNNPEQTPKVSHSHIEQHPSFFHTLRFGQNTPNKVQDIVPSDEDYSFKCAHRVDSYTLGAPLGQNIELHKDYFMVPRLAVLPFNSDKIDSAPKTGDDVPVDANTVVFNFWSSWETILTSIGTDGVDSAIDVFKTLWILGNIYSRGSIINYLGYSPTRLLVSATVDVSGTPKVYTDTTPDLFIEGVLGQLSAVSLVITVKDGDSTKDLYFSPGSFGTSSDFRDIRDVYYFVLSNLSGITSVTPTGFTCSITNFQVVPLEHIGNIEAPFNYERLCAYALIQAHYYTNDNVDYVYSADMLRNFMKACIHDFVSYGYTDPGSTFEWNGINLEYDYFSGHYLSAILNELVGDPSGLSEFFLSFDDILPAIAYIEQLVTFRNSLRFVDYFTGARTRPLAVGEEGIKVNDGFVSAIDTAREMQRVRYLNAVNRSGRTPEEYNKGIFGTTMGYDYHNPMWLGSTSDTIYTVETENTGSAQFEQNTTVTARMRSNADRYAFSFRSDVYGTLIGIEYCDIKRVYTDVRERNFFIKDRYDMFIPQMQFIGDQPIYKAELGLSRSIDNPEDVFGYTTRDSQYKMAISRAVGGFDGFLPGYSFALRAFYGNGNVSPVVINPDFIRAKPSELDEFYPHLSYYSPAGYFHFIVFQDEEIHVDRPMIMNPQILG